MSTRHSPGEADQPAGPPSASVARTRRVRDGLNQNGMSDSDLAIALVVGGSQRCPAGGDTCDPVGS